MIIKQGKRIGNSYFLRFLKEVARIDRLSIIITIAYAFVVSIADIITTYLPKVFVDGILDKNVVLARRAVAAFLSVIVFYNIVAVICAVILSDRKEKRQMFFVERLFSHTFCVKQEYVEGTQFYNEYSMREANLEKAVDHVMGSFSTLVQQAATVLFIISAVSRINLFIGLIMVVPILINLMISLYVNGLNIEGYQAHNFNGLQKLLRTYTVTHVFISQSEYAENIPFYEDLAGTLQVVVIAEKDFLLSRESKLLLIRKPFFTLSVVNLLNGEVKENGFEEAQAAGRKPFSCTGVRALAVDDEEMNLVVAKGVLGSYGIQVDTCLSGREAVIRCADISYDIVFLDHMMPGFDGVETLKKIREMKNGIYQDLPVIALTANTVSGAREMFRSEGFTEFIPKPIERAVLERVLRKVLPEHCIRYGSATLSMPPQPIPASSDPLPEDSSSELPAASAPHPFRDSDSNADTALPFAPLSQIGINVQMGLDYCCEDEDFYMEMLQMFHSQSTEKKAEIISLYEAADWKDYAVRVHALKSTSLTIGAEKLSEQARLLEQAGKKADVEYIRQNHATLLSLYDQVCQSIARLE